MSSASDVPGRLDELRRVFDEASSYVKEGKRSDPNALGGYSKKLMAILAGGRNQLGRHENELSGLVREHLERAREHRWFGLCDHLAWTAAWLGDRGAAPEITAFLADIHRSDHYGAWAIEALARLGESDRERLLAIIMDKTMSDQNTLAAARALRLYDAAWATERMADALAACQDGPYDLAADKLRDCLHIIGTGKARRLAGRSLLDRLLFRKRWLRPRSSVVAKFRGAYDDDSLINDFKAQRR